MSSHVHNSQLPPADTDRKTYIGEIMGQTEARIANPRLFQQGRLGVCGAAALARYMALVNPVLYRRTMHELATTGQSQGALMNVHWPCNKPMPNSELAHMLRTQLSDVLLLGSITHTMNHWLRYNPLVNRQGFRSFMWPHDVVRFATHYMGVPRNRIITKLLPSRSYIEGIDFSHYYAIATVHLAKHGRIVRGFPSHYIQLTGISTYSQVVANGDTDGEKFSKSQLGTNNGNRTDGQENATGSKNNGKATISYWNWGERNDRHATFSRGLITNLILLPY